MLSLLDLEADFRAAVTLKVKNAELNLSGEDDLSLQQHNIAVLYALQCLIFSADSAITLKLSANENVNKLNLNGTNQARIAMALEVFKKEFPAGQEIDSMMIFLNKMQEFDGNLSRIEVVHALIVKKQFLKIITRINGIISDPNRIITGKMKTVMFNDLFQRTLKHFTEADSGYLKFDEPALNEVWSRLFQAEDYSFESSENGLDQDAENDQDTVVSLNLKQQMEAAAAIKKSSNNQKLVKPKSRRTSRKLKKQAKKKNPEESFSLEDLDTVQMAIPMPYDEIYYRKQQQMLMQPPQRERKQRKRKSVATDSEGLSMTSANTASPPDAISTTTRMNSTLASASEGADLEGNMASTPKRRKKSNKSANSA